MTSNKANTDKSKQHDFKGLRDRLAKIDHNDILTKGRFWLRVGAKTDLLASLTLSTAVKVTGISRDDFLALIELGLIEPIEGIFGEPLVPIEDLCTVVEDSARYKARKTS